MLHTKKLTLTSMFAALICLSTMMVKIPIPSVNGYIHFGDACVIMAGIYLGPVYGAAAAGMGAALADLLSGYVIYVPITFIVKALMAGGIGCLFHRIAKSVHRAWICNAFCGIYAMAVNVLGYFLFERILYGDAALLSIPANVVQGLFGIVMSSLLIPMLNKLRFE